ncbi:phospholipid phosphatase 1-like [Haliotis rubra]|uniref:phospholipid phosphatase 1-like n=1 Tax=Haliotis rubra TaxID=36100 RepID=UPI001EE560B0|nr:phospholipid phosphatase 1-like [Haliotis rubra]XP_046573748.1 phospholipid phosphatase 1-like [Haliotis rubra]
MARRISVPSRYKWRLRLAGDVCIIVIIAIITITFSKMATPVHQGFQCHDPRLQQPYKAGASVPNAVLYGIGFGLPAVVMILAESFIIYKQEKGSNRWGSMILKSFEAIVPFFFGGAVTHLTTNVPKFVIGRLRPNFFDVCKPDWSMVDCSNGGYITKNICTETNTKLIDKTRVSFPSGHASLSMYFMVFLILYLQRRLTWSSCPLLRPVLQLTLFYMALCCGLSRLYDHLHHWEDIVAGDVLGLSIAVLVFFKVRPVYMCEAQAGEENPEYPGEIPEVKVDPPEEEIAEEKDDPTVEETPEVTGDPTEETKGEGAPDETIKVEMATEVA